MLYTSSPSSKDDHVKHNEYEVLTWSQTRGKGVEDGGKVSTTLQRCIQGVSDITTQSTFVTKEVSLEVEIGGCVPSPTKTSISSVHYMLVLDVNGLLCDAQHVFTPKSWKLLFVPV